VSNKPESRLPDWNEIMANENDGGAMSEKSLDDLEVAKMKKELDETPETFVLNNLLMSVMFFEHFEKEKQRLMHSNRTTLEKELNPTLLRDETIECVIPDVIFEKVNKNVRFRRVHGSHKNTIEPLVARRMFVVNDNIEVLESKHTPQYSAIDKPSYQVVMEDTDHPGFVKLKCAPSQERQIIPAENEPKEQEPVPGSSTQSDDDIYEYSTITKINTPQPLNITSCERRDTLPQSCFTMRTIKKYEQTTEDSDEEEQLPQVQQKFYETISYISANGFMKHFQNAVFPNSLGVALGFDSSEIGLAKAIPGTIFCNLQDVDEDFCLLPCEIIPSVAIQWPVTMTFEFHTRSERPTMWNKLGVEFRWPTNNMIKEISQINSVLIPKGYTPKRDKNPDSEIEWEVAFPKAHRQLDIHMSHTQIRAFLFLLTIYKTYMELPDKQYNGLSVDHIRNHMYWECESNPRDWPEHRLGTKLVLVLKSLMKKLSARHLPDFFIKKKNMFVNVPNKHLSHAQRILHEVLESPAVHFIGALRNLRYMNSKFYPQLDLKRLYKILTTDNAITLFNSALIDMRPPNMFPKNRAPPVQGDNNYKKDVLWRMNKEKQIREKVLQKKREQQNKNLNNERRASVDSIDFDWQCEKTFDTSKIREMLIFFIKHFLEMARKSRKLATQKHALFYLKQSYYLARLLEACGLQADAKEWYGVITKEEDTSKKISVTESFDLPPSTPKRNSAQFNNWELTQQVMGKNINLNNLNTSYNNTSTVTTNFNKLKKHPSNLKKRSSVLRNNCNINEDRRKSLDTVRRSVTVGFSDHIEIR
jgi:hypothetical protein